MYLSFNLGCSSIELDIARYEQGGKGFSLNKQNSLSMTKFIFRRYLEGVVIQKLVSETTVCQLSKTKSIIYVGIDGL